jgi:hypothetical protein
VSEVNFTDKEPNGIFKQTHKIHLDMLYWKGMILQLSV